MGSQANRSRIGDLARRMKRRTAIWPRKIDGLMTTPNPAPISEAEEHARRGRIARIARRLGFVGHVEYRHVYSQSGGAQYGRGRVEDADLLTVYAEAFERDADPNEFSLEAILAHERGHQLFARHPRVARRVGGLSVASEEILASLLGAMICWEKKDRDELVAKATAALLVRGQPPDVASRQIYELWRIFEALL